MSRISTSRVKIEQKQKEEQITKHQSKLQSRAYQRQTEQRKTDRGRRVKYLSY